MMAEALSFEPVYVDGCTLAPTPSMADDAVQAVGIHQRRLDIQMQNLLEQPTSIA
jgi:hypothetical protein